jgi:hypothetical protein
MNGGAGAATTAFRSPFQFKETALRLAVISDHGRILNQHACRYNLEVARINSTRRTSRLSRALFWRVLCPLMKICQVWKHSRKK